MRYTLIFLLLVILISCNPIPDSLKIKSTNLITTLDNTEKSIEANEIQFKYFLEGNIFLRRDEGKIKCEMILGKILIQEKLKSNFTKARETLKTCYTNKLKIQELINDNDNKKASQLESEIAELEAKLALIYELIRIPMTRGMFFIDIYRDYETFKKTNDSLMTQLSDSLRSVSRYVKITSIKYSAKKESLSKELLQIELNLKMNKTIRDSFLVQYNYRKNDKLTGYFDLKKFGDSYQLFYKNRQYILSCMSQLKSKLAELDLSYTKILDDTDADFYVTIARTSWDESSDYGEQDYTYKRLEVSESVFEYIDQLDDNAIIAEYTTWSAGLTTHISDSIWSSLKIDPKEGWLSSLHDRSEFWVQASDVVYYHKYMIEKNGKLDSTDYIPVSEADYYKYEDADGLAIFSKTTGKFNSEADTIPAIPGISHVGNNQYGEWRDSTSNQRRSAGVGAYWFFYRPYMYYNIWGGTHTYSNYNTYSSSYRNHTPYYGSVGREQHYRNYSSRRGHTSQSSFRNGSSYRGGGAGGGGK
jgi:hypothetical protein